MMKTTVTTKPHDLCFLIRPTFGIASLHSETTFPPFLKSSMDAIRVVVTGMAAKEPAQVVLVENDHVINDLSLA